MHKELRDAADQHMRTVAEDQKRALRKHLDGEAARFRALVRPLAGVSGANLAPLAVGGLMATDVAKLEGEWRLAVTARLAELG